MGRSRLPFYVPVPSEAKMVPTAAAAQRHTKSRRRTRVRTAPVGPAAPPTTRAPRPPPPRGRPGQQRPQGRAWRPWLRARTLVHTHRDTRVHRLHGL